MMMADNNTFQWVDDESMIVKSSHPVHIKDNATGKCCGIHFSCFSSLPKLPAVITFGLQGSEPQPQMAVPSDDVSIGPLPLMLHPVLNEVGEYTLHMEALEKNKVLIDGIGVINLEYSYQLYHEDTFQAGNSTFTVYFNHFKPK